MNNQDDQIEPEPEEGAVRKTEGEDTARAYVASAVPKGTGCPTVEVDRVRILPPSQTPTVELAALARRPGPRAPEQMVKAEPKGPVELPDGRPLTKMQRLEIDSDFLIELARERAEGKTRTVGEGEEGEGEVGAAAAAAEVHAVEAAQRAPASTPVVVVNLTKKPVLMVAAIVATAGVVLIAAMRPVGGPAPGVVPSAGAKASVTVVPSATVVPSVTVPSATVAPTPSTVPSAAGTPSATTVPASANARGTARAASKDPYDEPAVSAPSARPIVPAPAPPAVAPGLPGGDKTEF